MPFDSHHEPSLGFHYSTSYKNNQTKHWLFARILCFMYFPLASLSMQVGFGVFTDEQETFILEKLVAMFCSSSSKVAFTHVHTHTRTRVEHYCARAVKLLILILNAAN